MEGFEKGARPELGSRALFKTLKPAAYLAHAGISPASDPVRRAVARVLDRSAAAGVSAFATNLELRDDLRRKLARLINATPRDIGFVSNTGHGLAAIASSVPFAPGDRIVMFRGEYPSNVSVFQCVAERLGLVTVFLEAADFARDREQALQRLRRELEGGVALVAVSAVQFQSGLRMPLQALGALCRQHGALLSVDGVQALGVVPLDVQACQVDLLACGAHKWLMGIEGAGFLYVRPEVMGRLRPLLVGNMSHVDATEVLHGATGRLRYDRPLLSNPQVFEGGMLNGAGIAALDASVGLILDLGVEAIFRHVNAYHDALEPALIRRGFTSLRSEGSDARSAILAAHPPADLHAGDLAQGLSDRGVVCTSPDGVLRFAPHWPNALSEVPVVCAALDEVLDDLRR